MVVLNELFLSKGVDQSYDQRNIDKNTLENKSNKKARQGILTSLFCFYVPVVFLIVVLSGCSQKEKSLFFSGQTMGTTYHIRVVPEENAVSINQTELAEKIEAVLQSVNQSMSTYIPSSELSKLNADESGNVLSVSTMLGYVLKEAIDVGQITFGALDVTIGPLVDLWGFGPGNIVVSAPSETQIKQYEAIVGLNKLQLDEKALTLKKPVGMRIDLSAIAKGYGADAIAALFIESGIQNFLIEVGGELVTSGVNANQQPWRIGVEKPTLDHQGVQQAIAVSGKGIATSGDYRNYFEQDGIRFSHIIDPRTGYPVKNTIASVTVIAETATKADGLATAFSVLGEKEMFELAEKYDFAVYAILREGESFIAKQSTAFDQYLN